MLAGSGVLQDARVEMMLRKLAPRQTVLLLNNIMENCAVGEGHSDSQSQSLLSTLTDKMQEVS